MPLSLLLFTPVAYAADDADAMLLMLS